jgi:hypothetical protein
MRGLDHAETELRNHFADTNAIEKYRTDSESLKERIGDLFQNKVGLPYSVDVLATKQVLANCRFKDKTPPGYEDEKSKKVPEMYGDVILWFQLLDHAEKTCTPVILVTDDNKEDWWLRKSGKTLGPRPELRAEMKTRANVDFYMYQSELFMKFAESMLGVKPKAGSQLKEILEEAQAIRETVVQHEVPLELEMLYQEMRGLHKQLCIRLNVLPVAFNRSMAAMHDIHLVSDKEIDLIRRVRSHFLRIRNSGGNFEIDTEELLIGFMQAISILNRALRMLDRQGDKNAVEIDLHRQIRLPFDEND